MGTKIIVFFIFRMVSKCLCLNRFLHTRRTGRVVGRSCQCMDGRRRMEGEVARTVCCSSKEEEDGGDSVFNQQSKRP